MFRITLIIFLVSLSNCIGGVSSKESITDEFFQQRRKSIDIIDLIALFRKDYSLGDWEAFSNDRRFDWDREGVNGEDLYYNTFFAKNGRIYITVNGEFIRYNSVKHAPPDPWYITLAGGRAGFAYVVIDSRSMSHEFNGFSDYFKQRKVLVKEEFLECAPPFTGCEIRKMFLNVNGKEITVMEEESGGGTAGPAYTLYMRSDGTDDNIMPSRESQDTQAPALKNKQNK